jgi:hypothetical protein
VNREDKVKADREDVEGYDADTEHVAAAGRQAWRSDADFEAECDRAYLIGVGIEERAKADRIREYETSPAQREWEGHDAGCESEFISEAGLWSPCRCGEAS